MIALTGGTGFIGFFTAKRLKERGVEFVCLVRGKSKGLARLTALGAEIRETDFRNENSIFRALEGCDTVINSLGLINGTEEALREANVNCTERLIGASVRRGIKRLVHVGSVAAVRRHSIYGMSKHEGEERVRKSGVPYVILQPAYIYGSGDDDKTGLMLRILKRFPVVPLLGGGNFKIQPVYVDDVVDMIFRALETSHINKSYILAGAEQVALRDMLRLFADAQGLKRLFLPVPLKPLQAVLRVFAPLLKSPSLPVKQILELDKHEAFDISDAALDLDFRPVDFKTGVEKMFGRKLCAG